MAWVEKNKKIAEIHVTFHKVNILQVKEEEKGRTLLLPYQLFCCRTVFSICNSGIAFFGCIIVNI